MNILFLSQRVPYPPNRGDKITTWRLVERMRRAHQVRCIAFAHDAGDLAAARELEAKGIPITTFPYHDRWSRIRSLPRLATSRPLTLGVYGSSALQAAVDRAMPDVDLAYAYSSSMGAFLVPHAGKARIMHFGELDSDKWRQYAERSSLPWSWVYRRESRTLLEFERRVARSFSQNVLCTPLEQRIFAEQIPGAPSAVLRNGVDLCYYEPAERERTPLNVVFTGIMNYYPNVDGCIFFAREILPKVRARFPGTTFTIVGAHPTPEIRRLAEDPSITVTGFVTDTRDHLRRASVSVAPLRIARGIQNKVLEAMAMGLPVVGTTSATQGVEGRSGRDYIVAEEADAFAAAVCRLLENPDEARELGRRARRFVEDHYDWEVVFRPLDEMLEDCRARSA